MWIAWVLLIPSYFLQSMSGSVLCGPLVAVAVLSLSCQGQGRVSHRWFLWCSPPQAFFTAIFLPLFLWIYFPHPFKHPVHTFLCHKILIACIDPSACLCSCHSTQALLLSVCLSVSHSTSSSSLPPLTSIYLRNLYQSIQRQMGRGASHSPLRSIGCGEPL